MKQYIGYYKSRYNYMFEIDLGIIYAENKERALLTFKHMNFDYEINDEFYIEVFELKYKMSNTINKPLIKNNYSEKLELPLYSLESMEHNIRALGNETVLNVIEKIKEPLIRLKYRKLFLKASGIYE